MSTVSENKLWLNKRVIVIISRWLVLVCLLCLDQVSKFWSQSRDITVMNHGGVLGIYPSPWWGWFLLLIWLFLVMYWIGKVWDASHWGMGFIVVGGLGNIIDRILFGSVRDFIYYPGFGFYGNIADILLFVGVVLVMVEAAGSEKKEEKLHIDVS